MDIKDKMLNQEKTISFKDYDGKVKHIVVPVFKQSKTNN